MNDRLESLSPGQPIPFGGDRLAYVGDDLARAFRPGDRLVVLPDAGDLLRVPRAVQALVEDAVGRARAAFHTLSHATDAEIARFFDLFAARLESDADWAPVAAANAADVERAHGLGRSTTRLVATERMRRDMI